MQNSPKLLVTEAKNEASKTNIKESPMENLANEEANATSKFKKVSVSLLK